MLSAEELEAEYYRRLKEQQFQDERRKFSNQERDLDLERVWVAHVWTEADPTLERHIWGSTGEWLLAGFRRKRSLRKEQTMNRFFSKVRRKLGIDKKAPVLVVDLGTAVRRAHGHDQSWRYRAPQFQRRKVHMENITPKIDRTKRKTRAKQRAHIFNPKVTKYVALGRHSWNKRKRGYLYLGPLRSDAKRSAQFEAKRLFPIYDDLLVVATHEMSKPLRAAMARNRRVRAGVTRLAWPEVPPTFDHMWDKFVKRLVTQEFHDAIEVDDPGLLETKEVLQQMWEAQKQPWLTMAWFRKQIKPWIDPCPPKRTASKKGKSRASSTKTTPQVQRSARKTPATTPAKLKVRSGGSVPKHATKSVRRVSTTLTRTGIVRVKSIVPRVRVVRAKMGRVVSAILRRC